MSKKVDLVLTGHEHLYQRTVQLDAALPAVSPSSTDLVLGMSMDEDPTGGARMPPSPCGG